MRLIDSLPRTISSSSSSRDRRDGQAMGPAVMGELVAGLDIGHRRPAGVLSIVWPGVKKVPLMS